MVEMTRKTTRFSLRSVQFRILIQNDPVMHVFFVWTLLNEHAMREVSYFELKPFYFVHVTSHIFNRFIDLMINEGISPKSTLRMISQLQVAYMLPMS